MANCTAWPLRHLKQEILWLKKWLDLVGPRFYLQTVSWKKKSPFIRAIFIAINWTQQDMYLFKESQTT